ncbi:methionine--tRNA ligase mes1 [Malassezia pachydermatis]|uniref:methionine--tRNA ligase n=1 Tax=Malassezia pachydermatis TaxID=77020 RepID=A0A0M9VPK4_9BASI|nr:methionyl-trna synthetase [Malassezia pachydermatis]KOS14542.1 methionyl-trna synthetase [Malassezia pachydermatis]
MATPFPSVPAPLEGHERHVNESADVLMKTTVQNHPEKVLPMENEKNVLVTSALPYVNNVPHLGNIIGSTLSADVFARYSRSQNRNTLYICGTDEYGTATETKALEDNVTPQALCDKYHALHAEVYEWFQIGFDHFGRTTTPRQTEIAQDIFLKLHKNGYFEEHSMRQLYCTHCQRFLADRYVNGICPKCGYDDARGDQCDKCGQLLDAIDLIEPKCKLCNNTPEERESKHMFLRIDALQPKTEAWAEKASKEGKWSSNGLLITESWFKEGLRPFSVSRDLKWGVPVPLPGYEDKVLYVWFDAPIGYPSITANYTEAWERWWKNPENVQLYQFMGKDNVRFHTVIFPSCLIGTGENWTMLHHINTTEYLQYEGGKFSKSRNIGVFGDKAKDIGVSPSVWRYYLLSTRPETSDSQFVWHDFVTRNNSELLKNLGNFVNRIMTFMKKYDQRLPAMPQGLRPGTEGPLSTTGDGTPFSELVAKFVADVNAILAKYVNFMEVGKLRAGLNTMMELSARGNLLLSDAGLDNALFTNYREQCDTVILLGTNLIWVLTALVYPFMPLTSDQMLVQLNAPPRALPKDNAFALDLLPGHMVGKAAHLFKNIDEKQAQAWKAQFGGDSSKDPEPTVSKKAAAKARKAAEKAKAAAMPNTPEVKAAEALVKEQGDVVRTLKSNKETPQVDLDAAVAELLKRKEELQKQVDAALAAQAQAALHT